MSIYDTLIIYIGDEIKLSKLKSLPPFSDDKTYHYMDLIKQNNILIYEPFYPSYLSGIDMLNSLNLFDIKPHMFSADTHGLLEAIIQYREQHSKYYTKDNYYIKDPEKLSIYNIHSELEHLKYDDTYYYLTTKPTSYKSNQIIETSFKTITNLDIDTIITSYEKVCLYKPSISHLPIDDHVLYIICTIPNKVSNEKYKSSYTNFLSRINKMIYNRIIENNNYKSELEDKLKKRNLAQALKWCKINKILVKPKYSEENAYYARTVLNRLYSYDPIKIYKFTYYGETLPLADNISYDNDHIYYIDNLQRNKRKLNKIKRGMDTRPNDKVNEIIYKIRLYNRAGKYVKQKFNAGDLNITNAWLKMYEILEHFSLVPKKEVIKTFHMCEAPGMFISATNHYIKTKTKNNLDWYANSLNPYNKKVVEKLPSLFKDEYGLIGEYRDRWVWGAEQTGDITDEKNIRSFKTDNRLTNLDFVTSDCGLSTEQKEMNEQEGFLSILNYAQVLSAIYILSIGSDAVFKAFIPLSESITVSILYLLYCLFDELYVVKPSTSRKINSEIYFVCKRFRGYPEALDERLFYILNNYNSEKAIFKRQDMSDEFINQIERCSYIFVREQIESIWDFFYYYDNYDDMMRDHGTEIEKVRWVRAEEWTRINKVKSIENKDKLIIKNNKQKY